MARPTCPYCQRKAKLVTGNALFPHRHDLAHRYYWSCDPCRAWVGCHPPAHRNRTGPGIQGQGDGTIPMGQLANATLRRARSAAHAAFDPLWKSKRMTRFEAYAWLAEQLGTRRVNTHIGMMDLDGCRAVIEVMKQFEGAKDGQSCAHESEH